LGKPTPFSDSLQRKYFPKTRSVLKTNVSEGLSKSVTAQTLPQAAKKAVSNTNVLRPRMYRIDNRTAHTRAPQLLQTIRNTNLSVSTSTRVNHKPNVSRPQLKSNQSRDKVLPNNSQVKAKETRVEVHPRIPNALAELQCMYLHKVKECDCLAQKLSKQTESVSKKVHTELLQRFAKVEKHSISLEIALQNCKEQVKSDTICIEKASNVFRKEREQYFKIQDLKAQMQHKNIAISELKKLIEEGKVKSVDTKFDRPSVV
nr:hypothetical protein [Tanacetum cinerariifolium]